MSVYESRSGEHLEVVAARVRRLALLALAAFMVVTSSYWYHQIVLGADYGELAENNRLRRTRVDAPRGLILDRYGRLLVENVPGYNLVLDRSVSADERKSLEFAAATLVRPLDELEATLSRHRAKPIFQPVLVAEDLTLSEVARIEASALRHPEFQTQVLNRRLYRHGPQTAHLLGYLGQVDRDEIVGEGLVSGDLVGREGVEQAFDARLRGANGEREAVVDSRGKVIEEYRREAASAGQPIRLTIDLELQKEASYQLEGKVGAVVALDPRDGAIRALVSAPSYDPNLFVRRLEQRDWQKLVDSPNNPLQNRAIQNAYPPGSVFKLIMGVAALSEGVVDPSRRVYCNGSIKMHDRRRRCWKAGGHGWMDLHSAVRESCDVYFYVAGRDLGIDAIVRYAEQFGLGAVTDVGLPGEREGLLPDQAYRNRRGAPWYEGETVSVAIGQGPILATPLQIARGLAVAANGGLAVKPYVVAGEADTPARLPIAPEVLTLMRDSLRAAVNDQGATGRAAKLPNIEVAGKTGTAQVIEHKSRVSSEDLAWRNREHAWFASFAPFGEPELVVVVFVEHGGSGSSAAAPIAKALYEKYFEHRATKNPA